jgi:hypothetical protein
MAQQDLRVRTELASDGSLYQRYHPAMRAVHDAHAARLAEASPRHAAMLEDRIRSFEGQPQRYGTQLIGMPEGSSVRFQSRIPMT